jgi:hypothetical protein
MGAVNGAWRASAAYLYVLTLDDISLAWEYLRRNPEYAIDWQSVGQRAEANRWGLTALEHPSLDARTGQPMWRQLPEGQLRIVPLEDDPSSLTFSLWTIPGRKTLSHDGSRLLLMVDIQGAQVHIAIHLALRSGETFGYAFSSALPLAQQASRVQAAVHVVSGSHTARAVHAVRRNSLVHMRTLQTLDAVHAKASQRDAATTLFGAQEVMRSWHPDSELRARIRHYVHRGRALMRGDYLGLLYPSSRSRRRYRIEAPAHSPR